MAEKRGTDQSNGGGYKRPRVAEFEVRLLIPGKVAGSVIGKGGCNIKALREEHDANVRIPDCVGPERVMTIQTNDNDPEVNINSTISIIERSMPYMTDEAVRGGAGAVGKVEGNQEVRIIVHHRLSSAVIGPAGSKVKDIREKSGAIIKVFQNNCPQSTDRCVAVIGSMDKIVIALKEIFTLIATEEVKWKDDWPYDPSNFDMFFAHEYGGYGGRGGGGGGGGGRGGGRGGRGGFGGVGGGGGGFGGGPGPMGPFGFGGGGPGGGPGGGWGHPMGGFGMGFGGGPGAGGWGMRGGGRGGRGGRGGGGFGGGFGQVETGLPSLAGGEDLQAQPGEETKTTQVTIPKNMGGAIIGPRGCRINQIRGETKAEIQIDEPAAGSDERIINITGTDRQIQAAQYMLQQAVKLFGPNNSGGPNIDGEPALQDPTAKAE